RIRRSAADLPRRYAFAARRGGCGHRERRLRRARRAAHSLKSSSRSVGALKLGNLAARLEELAKSSAPMTGGRALLAKMRNAFEVVEPGLRANMDPADSSVA